MPGFGMGDPWGLRSFHSSSESTHSKKKNPQNHHVFITDPEGIFW